MEKGANLYQKPVDSKRIHFDTTKFYVADLTEEEKDELFHLYGYRLDDVQLLTESQDWLFTRKEFVSATFTIQSLYKVQGGLKPYRFNEKVEKLIADLPILRTNFFPGKERVLRVIQKPRKPFITYHTLEHLRGEELDTTLQNIMAADRRRGFDLARDRLLRLAVFHTSPKEYAVLVTQPQLIADGWDLRELFVSIFEPDELEQATLPQARKFSFEQYLQIKSEQDHAPALQYWKKLLGNLPMKPVLPGYGKSYQNFRQEMRVVRILERDAERLYEEAHGDRTYLAAILQTAWGLVLQQVNKSVDTYFCVVMSNRRARLDNIGDTAALLNVMPVRMIYEPPCRVCDLVKKQFQQMVVSQPLSYCRKSELQRIAGRQAEMFDHFLNFHGFFAEMKQYSEVRSVPGVVPVMVSSLDTQGMDLGIYFRHDGQAIVVEFAYNANCFSEEGIAGLIHNYIYTLHKMLEYWDAEVYRLKKDLVHQETDRRETLAQVSKTEICEFLHSMDLFGMLNSQRLEELAKQARLRVRFENDTVLLAKAPQTELLFVMQGKVMRNRASKDGWQKLLDVVGEQQIINEYALLPAEETGVLSAQVMTPRAVTLALPVAAIRNLIREEPEVGNQLICHLLRELNIYQKRWVMS